MVVLFCVAETELVALLKVKNELDVPVERFMPPVKTRVVLEEFTMLTPVESAIVLVIRPEKVAAPPVLPWISMVEPVPATFLLIVPG
jgi:hypothetical protein